MQGRAGYGPIGARTHRLRLFNYFIAMIPCLGYEEVKSDSVEPLHIVRETRIYFIFFYHSNVPFVPREFENPCEEKTYCSLFVRCRLV